MGGFRLACRYIEQAVRRSFRLEHFGYQCIDLEAASIERFCALTRIPDLAKSVTMIRFQAYDDGTMETIKARDINDGNGSTAIDQSALVLPEHLARMLPATLLSYRDALLAAFAATENITELNIVDKYIYEDLDIDTSASSQLSPDSDERACDVTSTVDFVLFLMAHAGRCPRDICMVPAMTRGLTTGLTDVSFLVTRKQALQKVNSLQLQFVGDWRDGADPEDTVYARIGQQLHNCVDNLLLLTHLELTFNGSVENEHVWRTLAPAPAFPLLSRLDLTGCDSSVEDFGTFLSKHSNTLKDLTMTDTYLSSGGRDGFQDLKVFFATLATFPLLEEFSLFLLHLDEEEIRFPGVYAVGSRDEEDEDGYIHVWIDRVSHSFVGHQKVRDGLNLMAQTPTWG